MIHSLKKHNCEEVQMIKKTDKNKQRAQEKLWAGFTANMIRHRWLWLLVVIGVSLFFGMQMKKVHFDNSNDIWFVEDHPVLKAKARFDDAFGNVDYVYILFTREETPFTPVNLSAMNKLAHRFMEKVPYTHRVSWLGNAERIKGSGGDNDEVVIEDFFTPFPANHEEIDRKLKEAITEPDFVNNLISRDGSALTMMIELDTYPGEDEDSNPRYTVAEAVNKVLAEEAFSDLKPHVGGAPHFSYEYDALAQKETSKLFMAVIAVMALLLLWFGRGPRGIIVPLIITFIAVFWTIGSIGLMGLTMNLLSIALPTMLICVGIGDSMHAIASFYDHIDKGAARLDALRKAFAEVGGPIMLTSLTTAIGFLAYLTTHVKPYREMGVYVALGVLYAFILTVILTPIFYSFGKSHPKMSKKRTGVGVHGDMFDRWLAFVHRIVTTRTKTSILFFCVIMTVTFGGYLMVKVESNTSKLIFKRVPLRQTLDLIDQKLGATFTLEFLLNTGEASGIKDPAFMKKLDQLMEAAEDHPLVTKSLSVTSLLKKMRRALHGDDERFYALPDSREALAQYLFMYETSGGDTLDRLVGFTYDQARLSLRTRSLDTGDARELAAFMQEKTNALFDNDQVEIVASGGLMNYIALNDILFEGQSRSFIAALLAITIVMMMVLRSFKLGIISMIPNVFPVFATMGFMGLAGCYLDVITISFAAVIIGVAVDDTIHFFTRFKAEFMRLGSYDGALRETLRTVGRPITFTTIILILGNGVFLFSCLLGFFKLGLLFGFAFSWALLADFFFAPALIFLLKPLGPERVSENQYERAPSPHDRTQILSRVCSQQSVKEY